MQGLLTTLKQARRYPSLAAGLVLIALFVVLSIYAMIAIPYSEAVRLWRAGPGVWDANPRNAQPVWVDLFSRGRLSRTIVVSLDSDGATIVEQSLGDGTKRVEVALPFRFDYDSFPVELTLFNRIVNEQGQMPISSSWHTPDGRTVTLQDERLVRATHTYHISQQASVIAQLDGAVPHKGLLADPQDRTAPLKGDYRLEVTAQIPENAELHPELVVFGEVHGLAGTDHQRRDLMVALLWGAPIGIAFGILAAVGAQLSTFVLAGISTWFGGRLERAFQFITQVNLVLPMLPILIMVGHFYSRSIWVMLGLVIALNVFSAAMLTYRAMFLQAKESPYFEAAQAYGAGNFRIIFRYLLPKFAPTLLPQFVLVIPTFVFLEATLAVLGLGDPRLPTWGKVMNDAYTQGALYKGYYYWITQPALLLMLMGVGFALVGFALDRIFNPRLRTV